MRSRKLSALLIPLLLCSSVYAAPPGAADRAKPESPPELREQSVYIPYEKLWQVFEKKGRGVFLPYEEFLGLWKDAEAHRAAAPKKDPPVAALVSEFSGEATVEQDVMAVKATVRVDVLQKGWHRVDIGLGDVAITRAEVEGKPARLLRTAKGHDLVIEKKDEAPGALLLKLEFAKSYARNPGRNAVSFATPVAPVSRWDIRIPEQGVKVDIQPMLAATDVPQGAAQETRVMAFVGATSSVKVEWTPKAEGARGLQALANVRAEQRIRLDEGVVRCRVALAYDISRSELSSLRVAVPAGEKVVNVYDANVREWGIAVDGGEQIVTVQLFEPARGAQALVLELERFSDAGVVAAPVVRALDAARQQGIVTVQIGPALRAEAAKLDGLAQLDPGELPASLKDVKWNFAYSYASTPFGLDLRVTKIRPRIAAEIVGEIRIRPEEMVFDAFTVFDVMDAGVFQLVLDAPEGFEIRSVTGLGEQRAAAAQVARHRVEAAAGRVSIIVELSRKALGRTGVLVRMRRALNEADLLAPTGKAALIPAPILRAAGPEVERVQGTLVVYGTESLRLNAEQRKGLRDAEAGARPPAIGASSAKPDDRAALTVSYGDEPAELVVSAERRAPYTTVRQLLVARIESGVIKYEGTLFADVLYSGVKTLRLDVPKALSEQIRISTPDIRRKLASTDNEAPGLAEGDVAWLLEGESEFMGGRAIALKWEEKMPELQIGKPVEIAVPRLTARGFDRAWGQVVVVKAESIHVNPTDTDGLRPVDPRQDLMPGAAVRDAAQAFEYHGDWRLTLSATRYEPKEVKTTSIERGLVRIVVSRSDVASVQALYRMRSARQRLEVRLPDGARFDTQPLRLNGKPVSLEQGEGGAFYVPLTDQEQDRAFVLDLRYMAPGMVRSFTIPSFPEEPAAQQVYLSVYMPDEFAYLGARGRWNDEMVWELKGFNSWPRANRTADSLLDWVSAGAGVDREMLGGLAVDGRHLLYSTLRPAQDDGLRICAVRETVFHVLLIAGVVLIGLALLRVSWARRALAVGFAFAALVLLAVFLPSAARSVVNNGTVSAAVIVALIWGLWFVIVSLPRGLERMRESAEARRRAAQPPPIPPPAAGGMEGGHNA